jgi:hypothetical protein
LRRIRLPLGSVWRIKIVPNVFASDVESQTIELMFDETILDLKKAVNQLYDIESWNNNSLWFEGKPLIIDNMQLWKCNLRNECSVNFNILNLVGGSKKKRDVTSGENDDEEGKKKRVNHEDGETFPLDAALSEEVLLEIGEYFSYV